MKFLSAFFLALAFISFCSSAHAASVPAGQIGVPGGVAHTPVKNQYSAEMCWAYAISGFAEGEALRNNNPDVHLSPIYLGFYHLYSELEAHLAEYQAYNPASNSPPFIPFEGSWGDVALNEALTEGMIPDLEFTDEIRTEAEDALLTSDIENFVKSNMLNSTKNSSYLAKDSDGINTPLFNDLSSVLLSVFPGTSLPRPNQTFTYRNQKGLTPKSFMTNVLKFNPNDYRQVEANTLTSDTQLKAVQAALKENHSVPLGMLVFGDKLNGVSAAEAAAISGVFSEQDCPNQQCSSTYGAHEVLVVNDIEDANGNVTALIVKNSWGYKGLDVNAQKTTKNEQRGYFVVTAQYLKLGMYNRGYPWSVVLPKDILSQPEFSTLN